MKPHQPERKNFPEDFLWGVSTSSYQIEGAVGLDGRGESIWDQFSHTPGKISDGSTGDTAVDHYHRYREDIQLMQNLGVNAYRFSIAWPRIIPEGTGAVNEAGLDFYDRLVDSLLAAGISPCVTLYHWDLPQALEDRCGWPARDTAFAFADYTKAALARLGDRVTYWTTHNEMWCTAFLGYQTGYFAPGIQDFKSALAAAHHVLLSHGLAAQVLREDGPPGIKIGISPNINPAYPASDQPEDVQAAWRFDGYFNRWFLDPLAGWGYPQDMWTYYGDRIPEVKEGDMALISAPLDFLGINFYSAARIRHDPAGPPPHARGVPNHTLRRTADREINPHWLSSTLQRLADTYPFPELMVTENGSAFEDRLAHDGGIHDEGRIQFLQSHIQQAQLAVQAGIPLKGYFAWSLMDNFEWASGYTLRYGLHYVDFETLERIPKDSAIWYGQFLRE
jgi:beta-glucosidase